MAKKGNDGNGSSMNLGEISTIRNILMGEQISAAETKFEDLERRIQAMEASILAQLEQSAQTMEAQHATDLQNLTQRVEDLQNEMSNQLTEAVSQLSKNHQESQQELGKMLVQIGQKLMDS